MARERVLRFTVTLPLRGLRRHAALHSSQSVQLFLGAEDLCGRGMSLVVTSGCDPACQNCDATHGCRGSVRTAGAQPAVLAQRAPWGHGRPCCCWHSARRGATAGRAGTARAVGPRPAVLARRAPWVLRVRWSTASRTRKRRHRPRLGVRLSGRRYHKAVVIHSPQSPVPPIYLCG